VLTVALVIGLSSNDSGAAGASTPSAHSRARADGSRVTAPEKCPPGSKPAGVGCIDSHPVFIDRGCASARKAVRFYQARVRYWAQKMGQPVANGSHPRRVAGCSYLAHVLQRKAHAARLAYARWWEHEWRWQAWLPDKFARVGACETGYGKRPGSWTWDSGTYVSAFGIYRPAYEAYHRWTGRNTPREQYEVASAIQARFGWSAWGCGGA
jgi:hypothetical protein